MRVRLIDPSAFTAPYDHALADALAHVPDMSVTLVTSPAAELPPQRAYALEQPFYRRSATRSPSRARLLAKAAEHVPAMRREARRSDAEADVAHYQWLPIQHVDGFLLPRRTPTLLTAHDVLPREPRRGQLEAQKRLYARVDAVVVHSRHGRERLVAEAGVDPEKIHVIPHGAFTHLTRVRPSLPPELDAAPDRPKVVFFGLIRPYKGLDVLLDAWRALGEDPGADLWIVGRPRGVHVDPATLPPTATLVPRFVSPEELAGVFTHADLAVLPYREIDQSGVLYTALAFGVGLLLSDAGGFPEIEGARITPRGDAAALAGALFELIDDAGARDRLREASRAAAAAHDWTDIARRTSVLYAALIGNR